MKKTFELITFAVAVLFAASCSKSAPVESPEGEQVGFTKCKIVLNSDTKVSFNGTSYTWNAGDNIAVYQDGYYDSEHKRNAEKNVFTTEAGGSSAVFEGTIAGYQPKGDGGNPNKLYIVYPESAVYQHYIANQKISMDVPATQTGLIADYGRNSHFYTVINEEDFLEYDGEELTIKGSGTLNGLTSALKVNIPASYQATRIEIVGKNGSDEETGIVGRYQFNLTMGTGDFWVKNTTSTLTISNSGNIISGDVYAVIAPNCYVESAGSIQYLENNVRKLVFTVYNSAGSSLVITKTLTGDNFRMGVIKDIGTLPEGRAYKELVPGELTLLAKERSTATVTGAPDGCTFYYTTDGTDPTTESATFDAATGFNVDSAYDNPFSRYTVKVLIHPATNDTYNDKILEGLVRNYPLNKRTMKMDSSNADRSYDVYGGTDDTKPFQLNSDGSAVLIKSAGTYYTLGSNPYLQIYSCGNNGDKLFTVSKLNNSYLYQDIARILFTAQITADSKVTAMIRFGAQNKGKTLDVKFWKSLQTNRNAEDDYSSLTSTYFTNNYTSEFQSKVVSFGSMSKDDYLTFFSMSTVLQKFTVLEAYSGAY